MKGIEIYKGKAVFYSMGNFVFDIYSLVPRAVVEKYGAHNVPAEMIRQKGGSTGYGWTSVGILTIQDFSGLFFLENP